VQNHPRPTSIELVSLFIPALPKLDPREERFCIPSELDGLNLFLRYLGPAPKAATTRPVLYIHGATFPSALSIAHRFDGHSWRDDLNAAGYHVWGLDFLGFGHSDRYPEMFQPPEDNPALRRAEVASNQIARAVRFITGKHQIEQVALIAHSWGTMAAGLFATRHPELVERMVFFAPIAPRPERSPAQVYPGWRLVSLQEQWARFVEDVPANAAPVPQPALR